MKTLVLLFTFSLIFYSCEKDYLIPERQVPEWLKTKIRKEEQIIKESPQLMNAYGAWIRYEWEDTYFFEYHNYLSSSLYQPITQNGDTIHIYIRDIIQKYNVEKCCKKFVWKAPKYSEP